MKKCLLLFFILCIMGTLSEAQVNWSASLGGGFAQINDYSESNPYYDFQGDYMIEAGFLVGSSFRKEGKMSWQIGIALHSSRLKYSVETEDYFPPDWDWEGIYTAKYKNRSLHMPFSFLFNVFEPVGLVFGPHLTYMIQSGMDDFYGTIYKKWIPGAHLGIYTPIGNRIQIMGQVRSDIPARFTGDGDPYSIEMNFRELSYSLQLSYRLNP